MNEINIQNSGKGDDDSSLISAIQLNNFRSWSHYPSTLEQNYLQSLSWLTPKSATLISGPGDLSSLAILFAAQFSCRNPGSGKDIPIFIKGDPYPPYSEFIRTIQQAQPETGFFKTKFPASFREKLQDFPLHLDDTLPATIYFRWLIVDEQILPWSLLQVGKEKYSRLENILANEDLSPSLIVLDGFLWHDSMRKVQEMLKCLKDRGSSILMVNKGRPPNNFSANSVWDNVMTIRPRRNIHCSSSDFTLEFKRIQGCHEALKIHLKLSMSQLSWIEFCDIYDMLKPMVVSLMKTNHTAKQIVEIINADPTIRLKRPMTLANLARLKRLWGVRSYRPEKCKRAKKRPKDQISETDI